jgi:fatty-acyl-CoA synthase
VQFECSHRTLLRVTFAAGVPTVWMALLVQLDREPYEFSSLIKVVSGGAVPPRVVIEAFEGRLGVQFIQAYRMIEAAPVAHASRLKSRMEDWDADRRYAVQARADLLVPDLEMRVVDWNGVDVPWDGVTIGEVWLRGPWIADEYYRDARSAETFQDRWYRTGDVATLDADGYLGIVDRMKDNIKSGGEWISSVDLENAIMGLPAGGGSGGGRCGASEVAGASSGLRGDKNGRGADEGGHLGTPHWQSALVVGPR